MKSIKSTYNINLPEVVQYSPLLWRGVGGEVFKSYSASIILSFLLLVFSLTLNAQQTKATAKLESNTIEIGQQTPLKLSIQYRVDNGKHINILWPEITDTIRKEIEVVSQSKTDTTIDKKDPYLFTQTKTYYITSFDSGYWAIPSFKFIADDTNGTFTEALLLQVNTVAVDTTQAIKDIKAPYEESYTFIDWLKDNVYIVLAIIGGLILIFILIIFIRRKLKSKPPVIIPEAPPIPAHIIAYEKLEKLKNEKLWQAGKLKLYHSTLSDIIREYIENRFKIQALEQTTDEILFGFRNVAIDEESKAKLKQVLILSDLVKFAKELPLPTENEMSISNGYDFIKGTTWEETLKENKN